MSAITLFILLNLATIQSRHINALRFSKDGAIDDVAMDNNHICLPVNFVPFADCSRCIGGSYHLRFWLRFFYVIAI